MNYLTTSGEDRLTSQTRIIDILSDVQSDVMGAALTLSNMATCAVHGLTVEHQQLTLLADVLELASEALADVVAVMDDDDETDDDEQPDESNYSAVCPPLE